MKPRSRRHPVPPTLTTYYTTSFRGIGTVTRRELERRLAGAASVVSRDEVRDFDLVRFDFSGPPGDLAGLATVEDVFAFLAAVPLSGESYDLQNVASALSEAPVGAALVARSALTPRKGRGAVSYRVIVQSEDARWRRYRREQLHEVGEVLHALRVFLQLRHQIAGSEQGGSYCGLSFLAGFLAG